MPIPKGHTRRRRLPTSRTSSSPSIRTARRGAAAAFGRWTRTGTAQPDAVAFYAEHGYLPIPRFGHYADEPTSLRFERALS